MASLGAAGACSLLTFIYLFTPPPALQPPPLTARLLSPVSTYGAALQHAVLRRMQNVYFNHQPADLLLQSWSSARAQNPTKIEEWKQKFYRAVFVVLNFSETCWQACFSEVNIASSERARGQTFSSTNDAHQREGAGRVTHALRRKSSERRPASRRKINALLFNASSSIVDADMKMFSGQTLSLEERERQLEEELIPRMMEGVYEGGISGGKKMEACQGDQESRVEPDD